MKETLDEQRLIKEIKNALESIRYGYVQIIIQDSKVVQIDKTEKIRLDKPKERSVDNNRLSSKNTIPTGRQL